MVEFQKDSKSSLVVFFFFSTKEHKITQYLSALISMLSDLLNVYWAPFKSQTYSHLYFIEKETRLPRNQVLSCQIC